VLEGGKTPFGDKEVVTRKSKKKGGKKLNTTCYTRSWGGGNGRSKEGEEMLFPYQEERGGVPDGATKRDCTARKKPIRPGKKWTEKRRRAQGTKEGTSFKRVENRTTK